MMQFRSWSNSAGKRWLYPIVLLSLLALTASIALAQGGPLTYGSATVGSLSAEAPLAFYSFMGNANDLVDILAVGISPDMAPSMSLLSPAQQQLATNSDDPLFSGDGLARITYRLQESGLYTVLVSNANGVPGDFLIRLSGSAPAVGTQVTPDTPAAVNIPPGAPAQFFSVAGNPGSPTTVTVAVSEPADPDFAFQAVIRDSNGQIVAILNGTAAQAVSVTLGPTDGVFEVSISALDPESQGAVALFVGEGVPSVLPAPVATEEVAPPSLPPGGVCSITGNVNIRSGPGTNYGVVGGLTPGVSLTVTGRNDDGSWYAVNYAGQQAWVAAGVVTIDGSCDNLPVVTSSTGPATTEEVVPQTATPSGPTATSTATYTPGGPTVTHTPTPTTGGPTATHTPSHTPTTQQQVVVTPTPSHTPTTQQFAVTPTFTSTTVPPTPTILAPTNTQQQVIGPSPTFTPSYTPTTPPAPQVAPQDANFNSPLNIPLDNTASVLDFVSYPGGDTEDRVRWDIAGMNSNSTLSGGRARLTIAVSCFGTGTENIQFFTGGQTYSCGQTIVDREVTYDSRTGQVTITAVGGQNTYVQWVLIGTATRIN